MEKLNLADGLIFHSEKQLKEYGEKIPADQKTVIEGAVAKLKEAHKNEDIDTIDSAMEELNAAWQAASQHIYSQEQEGGQDGGQEQAEGTANDNVADAEYEEVK